MVTKIAVYIRKHGSREWGNFRAREFRSKGLR